MDILIFALSLLAITGPAIGFLYLYIQVMDSELRELLDDADNEK